MMKKKAKKLVLAKETVKALEPGALDRAAGAGTVLCTTEPFRYCPREINPYG